MPTYELAYLEKDEEKIFPLDKDEVMLGRSPKADVTLSDYGVSRFHAKIHLSAEGVVCVEDLGSRNGTKVNDVQVDKQARCPLNSGDKIALGNFLVELREAGDAIDQQAVEVESGGEISEASGTIIRTNEEIEKLIAGQDAATGIVERPTGVSDDEYAKTSRILRMLMALTRTLISQVTLDEILQRVMDLVFEHIPAERGVLGLYEEDSLSLKVVRYRKTRAEGEKIAIPRAITNKVRRDRVSILTMDAQEDQRFDSSHSILMLGIRSAMCVPLWDRDKVIGIIYVDEDIRAGTFNTNDLDLLSALANYAAVAIERTRLNQKIQEEQATREKLARYHSPRVIDAILSSGAADTLEMQERNVTVSFTDVVGFTTMSESMEPREVGQVINEVFTELTKCIFEYEGTLDKYIGDCIMAVFGAPIAQEDSALRCVRAASAMHAKLEELNSGRSDGLCLNLRTGINTGKVVAGDIGSPMRKDYSVLGDTVNLASRLESSVAKPGWIVIGESTYEDVREYFECESLGSYTVKGKRKEVGAYRVLGGKPQPAGD